MHIFKKITLSMYLTLIRLMLGSIIIPYCIMNYLLLHNSMINAAVMVLFLCFSVTDFLDGFCARRYGQVTQWGATLDHLADKIFLSSIYITLVAIGKLYYWWAIILIGRELYMMGMREVALQSGQNIKVSSWGKLKTAVHMILVAYMILNPMPYDVSCILNQIESGILVCAVLLSVGSAINYSVMLYGLLQE